MRFYRKREMYRDELFHELEFEDNIRDRRLVGYGPVLIDEYFSFICTLRYKEWMTYQAV
jgi:hypothetical protein